MKKKNVEPSTAFTIRGPMSMDGRLDPVEAPSCETHETVSVSNNLIKTKPGKKRKRNKTVETENTQDTRMNSNDVEKQIYSSYSIDPSLVSYLVGLAAELSSKSVEPDVLSTYTSI